MSKVKIYFMHTIKSRENIKDAYFKYNVKDFALDTKEELLKILESTNNAKDLNLYVRVAILTNMLKLIYLENLEFYLVKLLGY